MSNNNTPSKAEALEALERVAIAPFDQGSWKAREVVRAFISGAPDAANAGEPAATIDPELMGQLKRLAAEPLGEGISWPIGPGTAGEIVRALGAGVAADENAQIVAVYDKLHEGKLGAHWLWVVLSQVAAGDSEDAALRSFGWVRRVAADESTRAPDGWFFLDHGVWHDRVTGQHLYTDDQHAAALKAITDEAWAALEAAGIPRDGWRTLGESIRKLAAPPSGERPSAPAPEGEKR